MIRDEVIRMIRETAKLPVSDIKNNLYKDLGLDSLSFVQLLLAIEKKYSIIFGITEMEACLEVGFLIALTEKKVEEKN
ncbi:acyl carrier protein [Propionispora hippei]|uniref:Acyl carrier protein n=1 Tax=Propionispora hippei DSM 15287 TaxID=1123003 RepID=A0A1M6PBN5_9FIRM|nr:acyl carrier protein [Propionispora hippei]SHK05353.1 acyl carrier protein [Propionispora hippei DSM 15287]